MSDDASKRLEQIMLTIPELSNVSTLEFYEFISSLLADHPPRPG